MVGDDGGSDDSSEPTISKLGALGLSVYLHGPGTSMQGALTSLKTLATSSKPPSPLDNAPAGSHAATPAGDVSGMLLTHSHIRLTDVRMPASFVGIVGV